MWGVQYDVGIVFQLSIYPATEGNDGKTWQIRLVSKTLKSVDWLLVISVTFKRKKPNVSSYRICCIILKDPSYKICFISDF
jgi:hypothetical protein